MKTTSTFGRLAATLAIIFAASLAGAKESVNQWEIFETSYSCHADGNPFADVVLSADFVHTDGTTVTVDGFYDGDDTYRIRFMPGLTGNWTYTTRSNIATLDGKSGEVTCHPTPNGNPGMVRTGTDHTFVYSDGTPYHPVGTTSYAWTYGDEDRRWQTLESLAHAGFNKLRFAIFPNSGVREEPQKFPYEIASTRGNTAKDVEGDDVNGNGINNKMDYNWDLSRFNVQFFRDLEWCIAQLDSIGVEADVILFHPYDGNRWGFDRMDMDTNLRYLRYVIARLGAFRNVWWSMANEWDYVKARTVDDWKRMSAYVSETDPYGHLLSIHGSTATYFDYNLPWFTHASIQDHGPLYNHEGAATVRNIFPKPIIFDEVCYEGDHDRRWGQLTGEEMIQRIWTGIIAGTYVSHGECFTEQTDHYTGNSFLATGGNFKGTAPARTKFIRRILRDLPEAPRLADRSWDGMTATCGDDTYLIYFGNETPESWVFSLPAKNDRFKPLKGGERFKVDIIDTWNMTVTPLETEFEVSPVPTRRMADKENRAVPLPGSPYILLKIKKQP